MSSAIIIPMTVGFMIFILGLKAIEQSIHRFAWQFVSRFITTMTRTPLHGFMVGTVTTAVLQSSTAVTVMTIGLVNARVLTFARSAGIILGTNIGTCLTTELISLDMNHYALPIFIVASFIWLSSSIYAKYTTSRWLNAVRGSSGALWGFSLLLFGMKVMQLATPAMQKSPLFNYFLDHAAENIGWAILAGAVMTALIHSSAAVISIIMGIVANGAMTPEIGIAIVIGANIGTCITALLVALSGSSAGRMVAWTHIILNVAGALLFAPFIDQLYVVTTWFTHAPPMQIARAQTLFNIVCSIVALPLCYAPFIQNISQRLLLSDDAK